jgi:hypothetical protein
MLTEYGVDTLGTPSVDPDNVVTAVFSHPYHGRLIERVILWVQPYIVYKGERYKLTWWGNGSAYYRPVPMSS